MYGLVFGKEPGPEPVYGGGGLSFFVVALVRLRFFMLCQAVWVWENELIFMKEKWKGWLSWLLPLLLVLGLVYLRYQYLKPGLMRGVQAPDFSAVDGEGDTLRLSDLNSEKYVLLYFWGSWCSVCRKENPKWIPVYERWAKTGKFEIVGIAIEQSSVAWKAAIQRDALPWPLQLADGVGLNLSPVESISDLYLVKSVPSKYLLKPGGKILAVNPSVAEVQRLLEGALR